MDQNTQTEQNNEIPMFQYSTFEQIEKALQKKGLKTRDDEGNSVITKDNLKLIKSLRITDSEELATLQYWGMDKTLKNLEINILSPEMFTILPNTKQEYFDVLKNFENLETLKVQNQNGFSKLDVSKMKNLVSLELIGNADLETVKGVDGNSNIVELSCIGCNNCDAIGQFKSFIRDKMTTSVNNGEKGIIKISLDIDNYPKFLSSFEELKINKRFKDECENKMFWSEQVSSGNTIINYTSSEMSAIHNKALDVATICETDNKIETIYNLLDWIRKNHTYDLDAIEKPDGQKKANRQHITEETINGKKVVFAQGAISGTNGIKNSLLLNQAVCEGFAVEFNYICSLMGIDAKKQLVTSKNKNEKGKDLEFDAKDFWPKHAISKINLNGYDYYCDPTFEISYYKNHKKEEFKFGLMNDVELNFNYYPFGGKDEFREKNYKDLELIIAKETAKNNGQSEDNSNKEENKTNCDSNIKLEPQM